MRIENNKPFMEREVLFADFQAMEQDLTTLNIYLSGGYTMQIGMAEWDKLMSLYEHRYHANDTR